MDGRQSKLMDSLQFRLSIATALAILVVALIAGALSYWWAFEEAIELQDEQLIRLAALVNEQRIAPQNTTTPAKVSDADPESHFVVQWLGAPIAPYPDALPNIPSNIPDGLQTREVNAADWRVLVKTVANGARVLVAQQTEVRDEIAMMSALDTLMPLIALMLLLTLMLAYLIRQVFAPLKILAMQLDATSDSDLKLLSEENLAREISPFVRAINRLLLRLNHSIALQRQFVRDAAHELRSPLTSISLQTERLLELTTESEIHHKLLNLHKASERTRVLTEQLLSIARAQDNIVSVGSDISLKAALREVVEDLLPLAEAKHIDLAVLGEDIVVNCYPIDLQIMIKNIIDNAIRYTPNNGKVEILLEENNRHAILSVKDSGPGIASEEQTRVLDPFYRVPGNNEIGSGLGLFIVKTIASRLHIDVELGNYSSQDLSGLRVSLLFPKPDAIL